MTQYFIPFALAAYYLCVWLLVARKSARQSIVIRYQPPAGLSPASMRYITTFSCDGRTYVAILAQLAARKLISISPDKTKAAVYLTKLRDDRHLLQKLPEEEKIVFKSLFEWQDTAELRVPEPRLMEKTLKSLQTQLTQYITRNRPYITMALLLSSAATVWMCLSLHLFGDDRLEAAVISVFTGLTVAMFSLFAIRLWDDNLQAVKLAGRGLYHRRVLLFLGFLVLLFPALWYVLLQAAAPTFADITLLLILVNMFAAPWLRGYTAAGRRILNQIHGFRQFLQRTEQDRLQRLNLPNQPVQAGQEFLPYAIALNVRELWGDQLGIKTMIETQL